MRRVSWILIGAAALIVLMIGGIDGLREQRRRAEAERAKQELIVGLRITGLKLSQVQARLIRIQERIGQRLEQSEQ
jgi:hypothetical protein